MDEVLIVGAGVIGLSLADELARRGRKVRVLDRGAPGQESSWAGAGILPPTTSGSTSESLERLTAWSGRLHAEWAARLFDETGIDTGYRRCGGLYVAARGEHEGVESFELEALARSLEQRDVRVERLAPAELAVREPNIDAGEVASAFLLPDEAQLRNPRHVKALLSACARRGVEIESGVEVENVEVHNGRVASVHTTAGVRTGDQVVLCTGAWSGQTARRLGFTLAVRPVRGQIALLESPQPIVSRVVNVGHRYLVPRPDGRLLIGATEEHVGFVKENTSAAIGDLLTLAGRVAPATRGARFARAWSGLRPGSADGKPFLGPAPGWSNLFVAAGHFRNGLLWSPATALLVADLLEGRTPALDLAPFAVGRPIEGDGFLAGPAAV